MDVRRYPAGRLYINPMMASRKRPDYSRLLPRPLVISGVMTLKTLADVRELLGHTLWDLWLP